MGLVFSGSRRRGRWLRLFLSLVLIICVSPKPDQLEKLIAVVRTGKVAARSSEQNYRLGRDKLVATFIVGIGIIPDLIKTDDFTFLLLQISHSVDFADTVVSRAKADYSAYPFRVPESRAIVPITILGARLHNGNLTRLMDD